MILESVLFGDNKILPHWTPPHTHTSKPRLIPLDLEPVTTTHRHRLPRKRNSQGTPLNPVWQLCEEPQRNKLIPPRSLGSSYIGPSL